MNAPIEGARGPVGAGTAAQGTEQHRDSDSQGKPAQTAERDPHKLRADYAALLALKGGFTLHELAAGGFLICRWNMHHHAADLAGVRAFLARLGVQP